MAKADLACPARQPVGGKPIEKRGGIRAADPELAEPGSVDHAGVFRHRLHFPRHGIEPFGATEAEGVLLVAGGKPVRPLPAVDTAEPGARPLQPAVDRCLPDGTAGRPLLQRVMGGELQREHLHRLRDTIFATGVIAEAPRVEDAHVHGRLPLDHPFRQQPARTSAFADTETAAAGKPGIFESRHRTDQRLAVGRIAHGAVHGGPDSRLAQRRYPFHGIRHQVRHPLEFGVEQLHAEIPGHPVHGPGLRRPLVSPEYQAVALAAGVPLIVMMTHQGNAVRRAGGDVRVVLGDDILVQHGGDRQIEAEQPAHPVGPEAGGDHHMLGNDLVLRCSETPFPGRRSLDGLHRILPQNARTTRPRQAGHGMGGLGRVDVTVGGFVEGADQAPGTHERKETGDLGRADQFEVDAHLPAHGNSVAEFVHAIRVVGHAQAGAAMVARGLCARLFQPAIQIGAELAHVEMGRAETVVGAEARGVPGGARGEFGLLDQDHVAPALLHQLQEQAAAVDAAADNGNPRVTRHVRILLPSGS